MTNLSQIGSGRADVMFNQEAQIEGVILESFHAPVYIYTAAESITRAKALLIPGLSTAETRRFSARQRIDDWRILYAPSNRQDALAYIKQAYTDNKLSISALKSVERFIAALDKIQISYARDGDVSISEEGAITVFWDYGRHHLEAEVNPNGAMYLFYRDREIERPWGTEYNSTKDLPEEFVKLARAITV